MEDIYKILVCEDDDVLGSMIQFKLKRDLNYEIIKVGNGREAKNKLQATDFSLVISDIHMPYLSGLELLEYVRRDQKKDTPFIILSSEGLEATVMDAFNLGATDFLTKPFSPGELLMRVRRIFHVSVGKQ
ncbi:MAG: response regulator transcription factor [Bacteroidota bacterium]